MPYEVKEECLYKKYESEIENEANAVAGVIIKKWGKKNPDLYV
jgi:hypothetical protein